MHGEVKKTRKSINNGRVTPQEIEMPFQIKPKLNESHCSDSVTFCSTYSSFLPLYHSFYLMMGFVLCLCLFFCYHFTLLSLFNIIPLSAEFLCIFHIQTSTKKYTYIYIQVYIHVYFYKKYAYIYKYVCISSVRDFFMVKAFNQTTS